MGKDFIYATRSGISKDSIETNRMLGISLQSQGLLDLAFEKFRKVPLDDEMRDIVYNLGLDYERKRMINKAISIYEYININPPKVSNNKISVYIIILKNIFLQIFYFSYISVKLHRKITIHQYIPP